MEARRYLLPAEEHDGYKGRLHEESHDTLDGQRSAEDVAHEPRVVRPVSTKLELEDDTRSHTHGEIDAEEALPELRSVAPENVAFAIPERLADAHDDCQSEGERHEEPMVDGC